MGNLLASARNRAHLTQHQLAVRIGYSRSAVACAETGNSLPARFFWAQCDEVLTGDGALRRAYDHIASIRMERARAQDRQTEIERLARVMAWRSDLSLDPDIDSEGFGSGNDALSILKDLMIDELSLLPGEASTSDVASLGDMPPGQSTDALLMLFMYLDDQFGGDTLYMPLSRYVARLAANVKQESGLGLSAFGALSQMAGWFALDANRHAAARRYLTSTVYVAHEAGDLTLAASALAYLSLQETYLGQLRSALSLARTALATARATPLVAAMLKARVARAQAALGQKNDCLRTLDGMRSAFDAAGRDQEPPWASYVDLIEVTAQEGACYLDLRMTQEASTTLKRATGLIEERAPHRLRDRVHYLTRLARCHLLDGDIELACSEATQALFLSRTVGSSRISERLSEFHGTIQACQAPAARDFREVYAVERSAMSRNQPRWSN